MDGRSPPPRPSTVHQQLAHGANNASPRYEDSPPKRRQRHLRTTEPGYREPQNYRKSPTRPEVNLKYVIHPGMVGKTRPAHQVHDAQHEIRRDVRKTSTTFPQILVRPQRLGTTRSSPLCASGRSKNGPTNWIRLPGMKNASLRWVRPATGSTGERRRTRSAVRGQSPTSKSRGQT